MKNIKIKDVITLDDGKKYIVVSKVAFNNEDYIYIVNINDMTNVKFANIRKENDGIRVSEIDSSEEQLLRELLPIFYKAIYR